MNKKDRHRFLKSLPPINLTFRPLLDCVDSFDIIFQDIEIRWRAAGNTESILPYLNEKILDIQKEIIKGFVAFESQNIPVGICWTDLPHKRYGNVLVHATNPDYEVYMAIKLVRSGLLDGTVTELIQFTGFDRYLTGFLGMGLSKKFRYRMGLLAEDFPEPPPLPPQVALEPLTVDHAAIIGEISYIAHTHRKDLEGYIDYAYPDRCAKHKKSLIEGEFGKMVPEASFVITYYGKPVGSCMVIDIACWGYDHMAWIFDIALHPDYHSLGLGKLLLHHTLKGTKNAGYPIMGLAVTVTNEIAYTLYEKTGFQIYEEYYEILSPDAMKLTDDEKE